VASAFIRRRCLLDQARRYVQERFPRGAQEAVANCVAAGLVPQSDADTLGIAAWSLGYAWRPYGLTASSTTTPATWPP
jgi:hypothetical protein